MKQIGSGSATGYGAIKNIRLILAHGFGGTVRAVSLSHRLARLRNEIAATDGMLNDDEVREEIRSRRGGG